MPRCPGQLHSKWEGLKRYMSVPNQTTKGTVAIGRGMGVFPRRAGEGRRRVRKEGGDSARNLLEATAHVALRDTGKP